MTTAFVKAAGSLLATYQADLISIREFHRFKNGQIGRTLYLSNYKGSFKNCINTFKVARNVQADETSTLLDLTFKWTSSIHLDEVDKFASHLNKKKITHGKIATSLASKVLFLNNPWKIFPIDTLAKNALRLKENRYLKYSPLVYKFNKMNHKDIKNCLISIKTHLDIIEQDFNKDIINLKAIRINRFIDNLLRTIGQENLRSTKDNKLLRIAEKLHN